MNVKLCDVCLIEGKFSKSVCRYGYRRSPAKIDLCEAHKKVKFTIEETLKIGNDATVKWITG